MSPARAASRIRQIVHQGEPQYQPSASPISATASATAVRLRLHPTRRVTADHPPVADQATSRAGGFQCRIRRVIVRPMFQRLASILAALIRAVLPLAAATAIPSRWQRAITAKARVLLPSTYRELGRLPPARQSSSAASRQPTAPVISSTWKDRPKATATFHIFHFARPFARGEAPSSRPTRPSRQLPRGRGRTRRSRPTRPLCRRFGAGLFRSSDPNLRTFGRGARHS